MSNVYRAEDYEWAVKLGNDKPFILHTDTGVIGRVKRFWTGEEGDRITEDSKFRLIEMESGNTFVAIQTNFCTLTDDEAKFYDIATKVLNHTIKETVQLGASSGGKISLPATMVIIEAALTAQLRSLRKNK